jgi:glycosyltransferase involved in cell wall biosynthesis
LHVRPINILDLRDTREIGGPGKTILETYRAIDHSRFDLQLGLFRSVGDRADTPFLEAARSIGMPIHEVRARGPYDPALIWRLAALVRERRFDIVHPHEASSDVITYCMRAIHRVPVVSTAHGWIGNSPKQRFMIDLDKRVLRRFDRVIAVSEKMQRDLIDARVPAAKVTLLHNAIVLEQYRRTNERGALDALVGRTLPRPVLVSIGRLSPEKGYADLVDALALVAARGRHLTAVLAGDGPSRVDLAARIQAAGLHEWVHLPGYVQQPARLLQDADLMVLPSHTEGLPNAVLEAFAMEVPVLATSVGGTPEVVTNGVTGRLVPAHSPESLAAGIVSFLDDPATWRRWAQQGRRTVETQFDFKTRTRKLETIYVEMMETHAAQGRQLERSAAGLT